MKSAGRKSPGETPIVTSMSRERGLLPWYAGPLVFFAIVSALPSGLPFEGEASGHRRGRTDERSKPCPRAVANVVRCCLDPALSRAARLVRRCDVEAA
jgi:hypothetical protein